MFSADASQALSATYARDVFAAKAYNGNSSTQTVTTTVDSASYPALVWVRDSGNSDYLYDTLRGGTSYLNQSTAAAGADANGITAFLSNGFSLGPSTNINTTTHLQKSRTFRNSSNFFEQILVSHTSGTPTSITISSMSAIGCVAVKNTTATGSWFTWHKDLTAGKLLYFFNTAAETADSSISVSGTTVTIAAATATGTYIVYVWAHDTTGDGLIQCGVFSSDSGGAATVTLGWEPQWCMIKRRDATGTDWPCTDWNAGWAYGSPTTTGFSFTGLPAVGSFVYIAVRRDMTPPSSGAEVLSIVSRTGSTGAITGCGFMPDLVMIKKRSGGSGSYGTHVSTRAIGAGPYLLMSSSAVEATTADDVTSFDADGITLGSDTNNDTNSAGTTYINYLFKRAAGCFDVISYSPPGHSSTLSVTHGLSAVPEMWMVKCRDGNPDSWYIGSGLIASTNSIVMPSPTGANAGARWTAAPTATTFYASLRDAGPSNSSFIAYLFASVPGVSKVFTYTGDGSAGKNIDCGFSAGARFVMIIRTTAATAQDIFVWDTVRGIVAGNDGHFSLNSTANEVTTDDSIDTYAAGFSVNQVAATNINVSGSVYIGLAIA